jgi:hypothetical protein
MDHTTIGRAVNLAAQPQQAIGTLKREGEA